MTHDHPLIVDAAGKCSACSTRKRNDGELALMQEEANIRTVAGELPRQYLPDRSCHWQRQGHWESREGYLLKNAVVYHEGALSVLPPRKVPTITPFLFISLGNVSVEPGNLKCAKLPLLNRNPMV